MKTLSETRAKDRPKMAAIVIGICEDFGAKASVCDVLSNKDQIYVRIETKTGLGLTVNFDKFSCHPKPNTSVLSWHFKSKSILRLKSDAFGSVNNYHYRKGTDIAYSFEDLCRLLRKGLSRDKDGTLFT